MKFKTVIPPDKEKLKLEKYNLEKELEAGAIAEMVAAFKAKKASDKRVKRIIEIDNILKGQ